MPDTTCNNDGLGLFLIFMFSLMFMIMQMIYNLHILPLDESNVSKPHTGQLDVRTCQIALLMILQHTTTMVLARNKFLFFFMIFPLIVSKFLFSTMISGLG